MIVKKQLRTQWVQN